MNNFERLFYPVDPWAVLGLVAILLVGIGMIVAEVLERKEKKCKERKEMGLPEEVK